LHIPTNYLFRNEPCRYDRNRFKENKAIAQEYKELLRISYQTLTTEDKKLKAFDVSVEAHKDQRRKSGEAYIFHPIAVAKSLLQKLVWRYLYCS
jgi:(p)ppGpp synthase/HD superfamily hydrolase